MIKPIARRPRRGSARRVSGGFCEPRCAPKPAYTPGVAFALQEPGGRLVLAGDQQLFLSPGSPASWRLRSVNMPRRLRARRQQFSATYPSASRPEQKSRQSEPKRQTIRPAIPPADNEPPHLGDPVPPPALRRQAILNLLLLHGQQLLPLLHLRVDHMLDDLLAAHGLHQLLLDAS